MSRKHSNAIPIGVIAGVTMIVAGDVDAAVANQTNAFTLSDNGSGNVSDNDTLEFDLFDSGLGTLTDVTFTLDSDKEFSQLLSVTVTDSGTAFGSLDLSFNVASNAGGGLDLFNQMDLLTTGCTVDTTAETTFCSDTDSNGLEFDGTFEVGPDGGNIGDYSNGGGTFDLDLSFFGTSAADPDDPGGAGEFFLQVSNNVSWTGNLTVAYAYTPTEVPTVVPTPAAFWLFGSGLAGLGFSAKRRRKEVE